MTDRLDFLMDSVLDESASDAEQLELRQTLATDPAARKSYVQRLMLHAQLQHQAAVLSHVRTRRPWWRTALATAVGGIAALLMLSWLLDPTAAPKRQDSRRKITISVPSSRGYQMQINIDGIAQETNHRFKL